MTDDDLHASAVALHDQFTHEGGDRRAFMRDLVVLAGSATAADALLAAIATNPAAAAVIAADDPRIKTETIGWAGSAGRTLSGYRARPAKAAGERPAVIVIHENRGLTDHIRDMTRRVALLGYDAVAPDFLSPVGGTPANEDAARDMIGKLDLSATVADAIATVAWLRSRQAGRKVAAIGFCWGGAMVNRLAVAAGPALAAGVPYYGPAPDPSEAAKVRAAMLLHYAGLDDRVNATGRPWFEALKAAGAQAEGYMYPGVNHAFNNDTAVGRYDKRAADLAWARTTAFLAKHLGETKR